MPGGQLSQDSSGTFNRSGGEVKTAAQPTLTGMGIAYYDRPAGRWIPASRQTVSDDGSQYAYADAPPGEGQVHLVDVASARDRVISIPASQPSDAWSVLEFTGGKIYLVRYGSEGPGTPGLWSLDPGSGQVHQVFSDHTPEALQGSTAWLATADSQGITDARTGEKLPDQILRRDLGTGATTSWFYRPGYWAQLMGLDSTGHPFVALSKSQDADSAASLWFVSAPDAGRQIFQAKVVDTTGLSFNITDKNGTWFGGEGAVYLYRNGGSLTQVSSSGARPAGRCA